MHDVNLVLHEDIEEQALELLNERALESLSSRITGAGLENSRREKAEPWARAFN